MELNKMLVLIGILVPLLLFNVVDDVAAVDVNKSPPCNFPAIFNFGDSNSGLFASQARRLLIELMADNLGVTNVNLYEYPSEKNFEHGTNFASSGASILRQVHPGGNPIDLGVMVKQLGELKARSNGQAKLLPKPEDFSKALYTIDIGQNDLTISYQQKYDVRTRIPEAINQYAAAIKNLYQQGARIFWLHNTAPLGCFQFADRLVEAIPKTKDQNNCYAFINEMSREFNRQLKETVNKLRVELPEATLTYVDLYTPMYELLTNYTKLGFADSRDATYDTIHRTGAANQWLAKQVLNGSLSDPPIPITHACHKLVGA